MAWHARTHLGMAVPNMGCILDALQILVAIGGIQAAALAANHVQRPLVHKRCAGADVLSPLRLHHVISLCCPWACAHVLCWTF